MKQTKHTAGWALLYGFLVSLAAAAAGMFTNFVLLLIGYLTSLPVSFWQSETGWRNWNPQLQWLTLAGIALAVTMIVFAFLCSLIAGLSADLRYWQRRQKTPDMGLGAAVLGIGIVLHGAVCLPVALIEISYLFIAAPVQYIARYLGRGVRSIFNSEAFDFPPYVFAEAVILYLLFLTAAGIAGYAAGTRRKLRAIEKKERDEALYARDHASSGFGANESLIPDGDFHPAKWERREEERFRKLNTRRQIVLALAILAFWAADVALWLLWAGKNGKPLFAPNNAFFPVALFLPFWPLKLHRRFIGRIRYAEVTQIQMKEEVDISGMRGRTANAVRRKNFFLVRMRDEVGEILEMKYKPTAPQPYRVGDHALILPAFRYPADCSYTQGEFCPGCGKVSLPKSKSCAGCRMKLN